MKQLGLLVLSLALSFSARAAACEKAGFRVEWEAASSPACRALGLDGLNSLETCEGGTGLLRLASGKSIFLQRSGTAWLSRSDQFDPTLGRRSLESMAVDLSKSELTFARTVQEKGGPFTRELTCKALIRR
jgi:hypothetical protein